MLDRHGVQGGTGSSGQCWKPEAVRACLECGGGNVVPDTEEESARDDNVDDDLAEAAARETGLEARRCNGLFGGGTAQCGLGGAAAALSSGGVDVHCRLVRTTGGGMPATLLTAVVRVVVVVLRIVVRALGGSVHAVVVAAAAAVAATRAPVRVVRIPFPIGLVRVVDAGGAARHPQPVGPVQVAVPLKVVGVV